MHLPALALKHDLFNHIIAFISDITILLYRCPEARLGLSISPTGICTQYLPVQAVVAMRTHSNDEVPVGEHFSHHPVCLCDH